MKPGSLGIEIISLQNRYGGGGCNLVCGVTEGMGMQLSVAE